MKTLTHTAIAQNPNIEQAREFYGINCFSVETHYIVTANGNIVYRHLLSGNDPQESRVFNPETGEDIAHENAGVFHYMNKVLKMPHQIRIGYFTGKDLTP